MFEYIYKSIIRVKYLLFGRQFISANIPQAAALKL